MLNVVKEKMRHLIRIFQKLTSHFNSDFTVQSNKILAQKA